MHLRRHVQHRDQLSPCATKMASTASTLPTPNASNSSPSTAPASTLQPLDLEKELSCSICTDILYQPLTLLDCLHTFCGSCLKEWFGWQAKAAGGTRPLRGSTSITYTCPSCRAPVRETRPNATVTTLLEMYLQANPGKIKSEADRKEIAEKFKAGESVLPLPPSPPAADRSRRRRTVEEAEEEEDQRLLQEVQQLSLRDVHGHAQPRPNAFNPIHVQPSSEAGMIRERERQARIDREAQAQRQRDRHARHRRREERSRSRRNEETSPHGSARRELESQLRARGGLAPGHSLRSLEHQGSLRTLMSRSGSNSEVSNAVQGDIMQEILEGGLLDELDFSNVDQGDQEAVSELIARAYLERHQRGRTRDSVDTAREDPTAASTQASGGARTAPPVSRPHLLDATSQAGSDRRSTSHASSLSRDRRARRSRSRNGRQNEVSNERSTTRRHSRQTSHDSRSTHPQVAPATESQLDHEPTEAALVQSEDPIRPPVITCESCSKPNIQGELHHSCSTCPSSNGSPNFSLCNHCYKLGKGCHHWYGFGHTAQTRYLQKAPPGGYPPDHDPPHLLKPQRYHPTSINSDSPTHHHETGLFCSLCLTHTPTCYWHCPTCNAGERGYCHPCVSTAHHCSHPLQALGQSFPSLNESSPIDPPPHGIGSTLLPLPIHTTCNACCNPIPPSHTRYHCPSCNGGDYDICSPCYNSLLYTGQISDLNGPRGWRKCSSGHRMLVTGFEDAAGGQRRVVVENVVGGWRIGEEDTVPVPASSADAAFNGEEGEGQEATLTWHDTVNGTRQRRRATSQSQDPVGEGMPFTTSSSSPHTSTHTSFPHINTDDRANLPPKPDKTARMQALWPWTPSPTEDHTDELEFPRNAVIEEVVVVNEDWAWGVYCRNTGVFPRAYGRWC